MIRGYTVTYNNMVIRVPNRVLRLHRSGDYGCTVTYNNMVIRVLIECLGYTEAVIRGDLESLLSIKQFTRITSWKEICAAKRVSSRKTKVTDLIRVIRVNRDAGWC